MTFEEVKKDQARREPQLTVCLGKKCLFFGPLFVGRYSTTPYVTYYLDKTSKAVGLKFTKEQQKNSYKFSETSYGFQSKSKSVVQQMDVWDFPHNVNLRIEKQGDMIILLKPEE